jgi:hypothetical protein
MEKKRAMAIPITIFTLAFLMVLAFSIYRIEVLQEKRLVAMEKGIEPFSLSSGNGIFGDPDGIQTLDEISQLELPEFKESSLEDSFKKETVLDLSSYSEYTAKKLEFEKDSTLKLGAGEYWISELLVKKNFNIDVVVEGEGTAKLFVETLSMGKDSTLNYPGAPNKLLIVVYGDIYLDRATVSAGIYSVGNAILDRSHLYGAIVGSSVTAIDSEIDYDENVQNIDLNF